MIKTYIHSEWFEDLEIPDLSSKDRIFLWGAGKVGSVVAHVLKKRNIDFVAFIDNATDKQGSIYCNHPVISPDEFDKVKSDAIVIVSCAFPIVLEILKKKGIKAYDPAFLLKEVDFDGYDGEITIEYAWRLTENALRNYALYYGKGFLVERLLFLITDKCSLKCKNCDGYMPYHTNPQNDTYETIADSYNKIMNVCKEVDAIDILGGEPLVHPEIAEITRFFVEDVHCHKVTIISNGTIVPSAELISVLKSSKCTFRISDYGKISSKKEEIIALLNKENIKYEITNYQYWDSIPLIQKTNETVEQLNAKYSTCVTNALYVKHGKLFQCSFVAGLSALDEVLIPDFEKNYIDLHCGNGQLLYCSIQNFAKQTHKGIHLDACKYCPGSHCMQFENKQPVAEQVKGILSLEQLFKNGRKKFLEDSLV